jgi:hypothetical protein
MSTHRATTYTVYPDGYDDYTFTDKYAWTLTVEDRGDDRWAVKKMGSCLNRGGVWEYEPSPSNRGDDFLERCRFTKEEALRLAHIAVNGVIWNGCTIAQAQASADARAAAL